MFAVAFYRMSEDGMSTRRAAELTTCPHCAARLLWVDTPSGVRVALDHTPRRGFVLDIGTLPMAAAQYLVYTSHADTCPKSPTEVEP
jgi:hypothetical protein